MNNSIRKIAFAIPSLGSGGAERVVSILANELVQRGYDVSVIMVGNDCVAYPVLNQVKLIKLNCEQLYGKENTAPRFYHRIKKIRSAIANNKFDLVISFMSEVSIDVCLAVLGMRIPVIVSERNDPAIDPASRAKQLMRKILYFRANGYVFQTPDAQAYFDRRIQRKSCIILNPLTTQMMEPYTGLREQRIVAVGRLNRQKNYSLLLSAFADFSQEFPDMILEIYGDGPQRQEIEDQIRTLFLQEKVLMKGFCKDVHQQIYNAAFFVMTSDFEGMPNALLEAMALGLPCISTDCRCGGPRMMIDHGTSGLLVPTGDREALCEAMANLASDPAYAKSLGEKAQEIKERVNTAVIVEQWVAYMEQICGLRRKNET